MVFANHAVRTVYGTVVNAFAQLDSSQLEEFAEHAILDLNMMVLIVSANLAILVIEISVPHAINHAVNVQVLKLINVNHVQMLHLFLKMAIVLKIHHVIMDSSLMVDNVLNVLITVLIVIIHLNAGHVLLAILRKNKQLLDRMLSAVKKSVVMELNMNKLVMMEIKIMVMVAVLHVRNNQDGSAQEVHPINQVSVENSHQIEYNLAQRVLLTWEEKSFSVSVLLTYHHASQRTNVLNVSKPLKLML